MTQRALTLYTISIAPIEKQSPYSKKYFLQETTIIFFLIYFSRSFIKNKGLLFLNFIFSEIMHWVFIFIIIFFSYNFTRSAFTSYDPLHQKTLAEIVREESTLNQQPQQQTIKPLEQGKSPPLINGAFGLGKNFHSFRAGYAFSPMILPKGWERWDFYLEFAFYILHRHIYNPRKLYIATITPFVRYRLDPGSEYDPYWDIGLGGAYRDKKKFGNIPISTYFSFHVLTSSGLYPFGTNAPSLSFRWYHFSNAKIKLPNNGIDIHFNIALEYPL